MTSKKRRWSNIINDELSKRIAGNIEAREIIFAFMLGKLVINCKPASFNLLLKCDSSSGKDWLVKNVAELFPENHVEYWGRITPKSLNFIHDAKLEPDFTYNGRVIYLEEITENTLNDEVMKVITSGKNKLASVEKGKAIIKEVKGKPVIIATSFRSMPSTEILNRIAVIKLNTTQEQIRAVLKKRGEVAQKGAEEEYCLETIKKHGALKRYSVVIPFARKIAKHFPANSLSETRLIDRFYDLIRAIACYFQNPEDENYDGSIDADGEDYEIAKSIFENLPFGFPDFMLSETQQRILEVMKKQKEPLDASAILQELEKPMSIQGFRPHLQRLVDLKKLEEIPLWNEKHYNVNKYQISEESGNSGTLKLPDYEDL